MKRWIRRSIAMGWAAATLLVAGDLAGQADPDSLSIPALERRVEELRGGGPGPELDAAARQLATAHNTLGLTHWQESRYDSAIIHLGWSRDLWATLGDDAWLGRVYNNLGAAHYQWGNYEPSLDSFLRSLSVRRQLGDERGQALVLTNVGRTYHDWQQYDRARAAFDEAMALANAVGDPFVQGYTLHNLGVLQVTLGDYESAREYFEASLEFYRSPDDPRVSRRDAVSGWALNRLQLALIYTREGDHDRGIAITEEVLAAAIEAGHARREARALVQLGQAYLAKGDLTRAVTTLERAVDVSRDAGQRPLMVEALADLAAAHEGQGHHQAALASVRAHNTLRDSIFNQGAAQRIAAMEARAEADRQGRENARLREERRVREVVIERQRAVGFLGGALLLVSLLLTGALIHFNRTGRGRARLMARTNAALDKANQELRVALSEVRTLEGLIPICMHCKKVRDDRGFWEGVESYISNRSDARFSHGICTECGPRHYGEHWFQPAADQAGNEE